MTARLDASDGLWARTSSGGGDSVLWLHGYTMDGSIFAELWGALPRWRHVALDLPGHGRSRPMRDDEHLPALAATIADFARRLEVRHLVGLSFGTLVALQVAVTRPEAFSTLVLAAPGLAGAPTDPAVERRYLELALLYRRAGAGPHMTALWMRSPPDIFRHAVRRPALAARLAATIDRHSWGELDGFAMRQFTSLRQDVCTLRRVRAATLVLLGEHELAEHRACARKIAATVPRSAVRVFADAGHLALLEQPAAAAGCIAEHLTHSPSAPAH